MSHLKSLSIKNFLDYIPRFSGSNLIEFINGCKEVKALIPPEAEADIAKLIKIRLFGDALSCARDQTFENMDEIINFFDKNFGTSKTYHDLTGELAKIRQAPNESVILYSNRVGDLKQEILKAATRENRCGNMASFQKELDKDCAKFFTRGLQWEIKFRMPTVNTNKEAREQALEIERDAVYNRGNDSEYMRNQEWANIDSGFKPTVCQLCDRVGHNAKECPLEAMGIRPIYKREEPSGEHFRHVNTIEWEKPVICQFCGKSGHGVINCFQLATKINANTNPYNANRPMNSYNNRSNNLFNPNRLYNNAYRGNNFSRPFNSNNANQFRSPPFDRNIRDDRYSPNNPQQSQFSNRDFANNNIDENNNMRYFGNNNRNFANNNSGENNNRRYFGNNDRNQEQPTNNNHTINKREENNRPPFENQGPNICYYCRKPGHFRRECFQLQQDIKHGRVAGNDIRLPQPLGMGEVANKNCPGSTIETPLSMKQP